MKNFFKKIIYLLYYRKEKLKRLKQIHKGEECYIFGGGVSIKWFDLNRFNNKKSIAVNYLPFHNDFEKLNVDYCVLSEPFWFYPLEKVTKKISSKKGLPWSIINYIPNPTQKLFREKIFEFNKKIFFVNLSNSFVLRKKNVIFLFGKIPDSDFFTQCESKGINAYHGSFRTSISLSIYMGFSKVYLIGFDYTHSPSRASHWFEKGKGIDYKIENYNFEFLSIARQYIEIITVVVEGKSDILPSVTYQELSGEVPYYKENQILVNSETLKILSSFPGYNIN
jgi:hypothetical protein